MSYTHRTDSDGHQHVPMEEARAGETTGLAQREIEAEMIRRVRAGQTVVRLKAGDPFVFGRGAEEVDALRTA